MKMYWEMTPDKSYLFEQAQVHNICRVWMQAQEIYKSSVKNRELFMQLSSTYGIYNKSRLLTF